MDRVLVLWSLLVIIYVAGWLHGRGRMVPQPELVHRGRALADAARILAAAERRRRLEIKTVDLSRYVARGRVPAAQTRRAA